MQSRRGSGDGPLQEMEMFVATLMTSARKALSLGLIALLTTTAFAQQQADQSTKAPSTPPLTPMPQAPAPQHNAHLYSDQNYAKPRSGFPNFIAPYNPRHAPAPNLTNSAMTGKLFHDGTIYLSLNDAVAMAIENNLDVTLQRYNLVHRRHRHPADQLRLGQPRRQRRRGAGHSGRRYRGYVSGGQERRPPAPAELAQAARKSARAELAPVRPASLRRPWALARRSIISTPPLTGNIQGQRAATPQPSPGLHGVPVLTQNTNVYNFGYTQGFSTGTLMSVTFNNSYTTTNSLYQW